MRFRTRLLYWRTRAAWHGWFLDRHTDRYVAATQRVDLLTDPRWRA